MLSPLTTSKEIAMKVKQFIAVLAALVLVLAVASPALAASLGISPSHTELEVPADGSATANFKVHYFSGDLKVSMVDIPLRVEPETIHVEPSDESITIELTIYGDESLGSRIYDGYVRFLGMSGETVAVAVEVKAKITNMVEGETPVLASPEKPVPAPAPVLAPAPSPAPAPTPAPPPVPPQPAEREGFPIVPVAGIAAGAAIIITLIIVFVRRPRY